MNPEEIYNPLDKRHLADSIARAFFARKMHNLPPDESFQGAGIYAIYYKGNFELYKAIAESYAEFLSVARSGAVVDEKQPIPIYIGKSDAPGRRKGGGGGKISKDTGAENKTADLDAAEQFLSEKPKHRRLYARLVKHSKSIEATRLRLEDFSCRYMFVDEIWVPLGEARLVQRFQPLWNVLIEGFGSNPEGGGRKKTARAVWDILHPGRKENLDVRVDPLIAGRIVDGIRSAKSTDQLKAAIDEHRRARKAFNEAEKTREGTVPSSDESDESDEI